MSKRKVNSLTFKSLLSDNPFGLFVAVAIGAIASLAGIALLGISGWFLSAAGSASVVGAALAFDYFTPGASVRLMAILRTAGRYGEQVFSHDHLLGLLKNLRLWVWDQRAKTASYLLNKQTRGDLLQRLVGDLDQIIKWPLAVVMPWIYGALGCLAVMVLAAIVNPDLVMATVVYALMQLLFWPYLARRWAVRAVYQMQSLSIHRRSRFMSLFSSLITLTIRGHWRAYSARLHRLDEQQKQSQFKLQRAISSVKLGLQLTSLCLVAVLFSEVLVIENDSLRLVESVNGPLLVGFMLAILGVNEVLQPLALSCMAQGQSKVGLRRLNQLQPVAQVFESQSNPAGCFESIRSLTFERFAGVHTAIGRVLPTLSVSLKQGERMRITGPSGLGKSSALSALVGDLGYSGKFYLNDHLIHALDDPDWQAQLAFMSQNSIIFQQSLAANLRLGSSNASDEELMAVLAVMGLKDWVAALPNKLNTLLGAQGRDLSGGQARRICLARALLRKSAVLVLDEPFDGLDSSSIQRISEALKSSEYAPDFLIYVSHIDSPLDSGALKYDLGN